MCLHAARNVRDIATAEAEKTLEIRPEIHTSTLGWCNDAPGTSQLRMEEM